MADDLEQHIATFFSWHDLRAVRQTCRQPNFPKPAPVALARIRCRMAWRRWQNAPRGRQPKIVRLMAGGRQRARRQPSDGILLF